ncbi:hypothetical protein FRC0481_02272 [Corynebacterium diphtheriae]|nr:hypothetical protein FRC0481_02272 [Corynebacterium diphtheriae]CAB0979751.1 hypothetical protein FRC0480_02271 [Corynebacterium diphtheriae]
MKLLLDQSLTHKTPDTLGIAAISMSLIAATLTDVNHSASAATADNNITIQAGPHLRPSSLPTIFSPAEPRVTMENNVIE